jgi:hypothetical protein
LIATTDIATTDFTDLHGFLFCVIDGFGKGRLWAKSQEQVD